MNVSAPANLSLKPLATVKQALLLADIRNQCRLFMTNDQREVTPDGQRQWFETHYSKQTPQRYFVWLLYQQETPVGYAAAKLVQEDNTALITEGLAEAARGKGLGSYLLRCLTQQPEVQGKTLVADVRKDNPASQRLHEKFGFKEIPHPEGHLLRYVYTIAS
jgi:L-amino acid N-acyltransferase YncA